MEECTVKVKFNSVPSTFEEILNISILDGLGYFPKTVQVTLSGSVSYTLCLKEEGGFCNISSITSDECKCDSTVEWDISSICTDPDTSESSSLKLYVASVS